MLIFLSNAINRLYTYLHKKEHETVAFVCFSCKQRLSAPDYAMGGTCRCPLCKEIISIPKYIPIDIFKPNGVTDYRTKEEKHAGKTWRSG